jgi:hypothetical protein
MDHGGVGLADALGGCVALASELAALSVDEEVVVDQRTSFDEIATACSSMAASVTSGDDDGLATGRSALEAGLSKVDEIFKAFDQLMYDGDSNEPQEITPTT